MAEIDTTTHDLEEVPIPGYGARFETLAAKETNLDKIAEALESEAHREGLPIPAGRGLPAPFRLMVDFLRQRRLVQDLGVQTVPITWLCFHAPPVGSGTLKWAATNAAESSFSLSVLGSGYGSGRKVV
jgi:hypothetical protein